MTRPPAMSGATSGSTEAMYSVREAVEAVAPHGGTANARWQRHDFRDGLAAAMEARVETRDLRHAGQPVRHGVDRSQVVRLVERRQRDQRTKLDEHFSTDDCRSGIPAAAVHDTVADRHHVRPGVLRSEPRGQRIDGGATVPDGLVETVIDDPGPAAVFR